MPSPKVREQAAKGPTSTPTGSCRVLPELDLSWIHGEDQHDGETRQEAQILDDKGDQGAALPFILLADFIHLRELRKKRKESCSSFPNLVSPGEVSAI